MAKTYGDEACRDFQRKNPFLSHIIWPEAQVPVSAVRSDMNTFFTRNPGGTYMDHQAIGLAVNLSMLGFFKYWNFGVDVWRDVLASWFGAQPHWDHVLRVTLPLGISFYTFQSMSYTIDVYRGEVKAMRNFIDFACFVSMFPQLVAGPIIRFSEVADQLRFRTHTAEKFARGVSFVALGMAKKVLIAKIGRAHV